jgi:peptide/nickel transport system substrate-binding protein
LTLLLAACVVIGAPVAGCGSSGESGGSGSKTFRIGSTGASVFDSPNPFVGISSIAHATYRYLYPYLVQYDKNLDVQAAFASKWSTSADGKTWTFSTQPNAKWSDGKPLTAKDAAWTYNTIIKFKAGPAAAFAPYVDDVKSVSAPDDDTLVVRIAQPSSALLANLQQLPILPEHVWASHAGGSGAALKTFSNLPPMVSGGPFNLARYKNRSFALLKRDPNWWGEAPKIDAFGIQQYTSPDALVQALKAKEIDLALALPPTAVKTIENTAGVELERAPGMQYYTIGINSSPNKTDKPEIRDPQVRLAMALALNRQRLIDTFLLGSGTPGVSIIPPSTGRWYDRDLKPIPHDPARANQILDGLGFRRGSDGIRVANGHKMSYELIYLDTGNNRLVDLLQSDLEAVGIELKLKLVGDAAYVPAVKEGNYGKYDMAMDYWNETADPSVTLSTMTCASLNPFSETAYCDREYDRLYRKQATTLDVQARQRIVWQMQEKLVKDRPFDVMFYPDAIEAVHDGWSGLVFTGEGSFSSLSNESLLKVTSK